MIIRRHLNVELLSSGEPTSPASQLRHHINNNFLLSSARFLCETYAQSQQNTDPAFDVVKISFLGSSPP